MAADAGTPQAAARRIGAAVAALGIERFDLMGEGTGAAAAVSLALATQAEIGDDAFLGAVRSQADAAELEAIAARRRRAKKLSGLLRLPRNRRTLERTAGIPYFHVGR